MQFWCGKVSYCYSKLKYLWYNKVLVIVENAISMVYEIATNGFDTHWGDASFSGLNFILEYILV